MKGKSKERKKVERGAKKPEDAKDGMLGITISYVHLRIIDDHTHNIIY